MAYACTTDAFQLVAATCQPTAVVHPFPPTVARFGSVMASSFVQGAIRALQAAHSWEQPADVTQTSIRG